MAFTNLFFFRNIGSGFALNGFEVRVVDNASQIKEDGIVAVGDCSFYHSLGQRNSSGKYPTYLLSAGIEKADRLTGMKVRSLSFYLQRELELKRISSYAKREGKKIVLMVWQHQDDAERLHELGTPYIMAGEFFYHRPLTPSRRRWYDFSRRTANAISVEFASNVDPEAVGTNCVNRKYAVSYVGSRSYSPEYYRIFQARRDCYIRPTPPFIAEEERREAYMNASSNLGLQGEENKVDGMVTERIFDALAMGAISLTDSDSAVEHLGKLPIKIKSQEQLEWLVEDIKSNREAYGGIRESGFERIRRNGTYKHRSGDILKLIEKIHGISFLEVKA